MKKKKMKKTLVASALAFTLITSSSVSFANNSLQDLVDQARKDMKEASYAYVVPSQNGRLATSVELYPTLNMAKINYQKARNALLKSNAKNKDTLLKELDVLYNERITKGLVPYIDAYNYADKYLTPILQDIKKAETEKDWVKIEKLYHQLSVQLKSRTSILYRFTGKAARDLLLKEYKDPANLKRDQLMVAVTVYMKVRDADALIADGRIEDARRVLESIKPLLDRLPTTNNMPMIKELLEQIEEVSKKAGIVIITIPTVPPTTGGGSSGGGNSGGGNPGTNFNLSIMHTNDTHAQLDNVAKRVTAVKEFRKSKPSALLIDAGDVFSGSLYFNEFRGQADVEFMNLMKYDLMTFGNHEFDLGSSAEGHKALADFVKKANFPLVSANVDFSQDDHLKGLFNVKVSSNPNNSQIYSGIIKVVNGQKVGLFGLTTAETKDISSPGKVTFTEYVKAAQTMVDEFQKQGVNKVVAVTHLGYDDNPTYDNDLVLAAKVKGIDVIVGGHSHTKLDKPIVVDKDSDGKAKDPTVIVQAYQYSEFLGTLNVEFDLNGKIVKHAGELISVAAKQEDVQAAELLKKYASKIAELKNEPTGATALNALENPRTSGNSVRSNETRLGNVITDGMLQKAKVYNKDVIMAVQNGGGIRAPIDQGPITVGEVITVLPFGNTLATVKLTGAELKATFETSFKEFPKENGGFLHVSGAKVEFDSSKPVGKRVVSIEYKATNGNFIDIQDAQTYTIATNAFTAKGGDGYDVLKKAYEEGRVTDLGLSDWENLRDHIKKLVNVDPKIEGRIVDVAGKGPITEYPGGDIAAKDFSGTPEAPKVYNGDVTVSISDISKLKNAIVKGNFTVTGSSSENISFFNIKVEGDADFSGLSSKIYNFEGLTVIGELIF
ncbi:5'-nucleotidase C-terminal domain-containing protein [Bacillus sp. Cr_A10]|uniref:5'-nucleotidase C-terminal domain-containing protein n=1 Tax=Bacillus sp. Cr_A10 TaxID=3033993 RepID=UPI0023DB0063|nr:5'-nucleotidase C-terminal domain-containing protein [Bacillus sp. Cr_A10]MDF2068170.1 5'-nucleotidase C-terminal domain-containing protein [Bacillus sp. Cr_A10]